MGRILVFVCTAKGFGVSLGLGLGVGFLEFKPMMDESSMRDLLLESVRGLKCKRLLTSPGSSSTWAAIAAPERQEEHVSFQTDLVCLVHGSNTS